MHLRVSHTARLSCYTAYNLYIEPTQSLLFPAIHFQLSSPKHLKNIKIIKQLFNVFFLKFVPFLYKYGHSSISS